MKTIRTKDGIHLEIPDDMDPNAPEVREAVTAERAGRFKRKMETPEMKARIAADIEKSQRESDPTKGIGTGEKILANIGAGYDTAWQGLKQLLPGVKGMNDEQLRDKRALDKRLAENTQTGIGADWMPTAGSALQFAGEVAPSLVIPAGAATGTAARVLPRALQATVSTPIRAGATGGAVSGALMPTTSEESRTLNTAIGAGAGALLPAALAAGRGVHRMASAERRAGEQLHRAGGDLNELEAAYKARQAERGAMAPSVRAVPETLSEATGSVPFARMESQLGRFEGTQDDLAAFMREQNQARYNAAMGATREADQLAGRDAIRTATTDPMREQALQRAAQDDWFHVPVAQAATNMLAGPTGANPAVRRVANYVLSNMDQRADTAITPERLYEVRKVLTNNLEGPALIGDEMNAAVRGAQRQTRALIDAIDTALDASSGGQWRPYLQTFQRTSRDVDQARAAQEVRRVLTREGQPLIGEVPELSRTRLTRAIEASRGGQRDFPLQMSPSAQGTLDDLTRQIQRAEEPTRTRKLTGTRGGGSQTSTDIDSVLRQLATRSGVPLLSQAMEAAGSAISDATKRELAGLLMDPPRAMAAIREAQRLNRPLTEAQQLLLGKTATVTGGALPRAMQSQQQPR